MNRLTATLGLVAISLCLAWPALAQQGGGAAPPPPNNATPEKMNNPVDSNTDRALQNLIQSGGMGGKNTKSQNDVTDQNYSEAAETAGALQLNCDVIGLRIVSAGREQVDNKMVPAHLYEVACVDGMGYLIVAHSPAPPSGFSCFAAEGQREALAAKGQTFDTVCELPANKDLDAAATKIIKNAKTACTVTKLQWFGQSTDGKTEYNEVKCGDGAGYLLATAIPGSPMQMSLISCADAATHGMNCQMTHVAAAAAPAPATNQADPTPTMDMLKGALAAHGTVCTVSDMRVIGKENTMKRHVVEFQCPEYPHGLVAFIPLGTNPNKYQAIDCPTAAKHGIKCTLTHG